jgi:D-beta-D-heptose 7-phosphate kinase/D-beta-D-heptose 1-phosphate adenosyltransferase
LSGALGEDAPGTAIRREIAACPAITPLLFSSSQRTTTLKTRVVAEHHQLVRIDEESADPIDSDLCRKMRAVLESQVLQHDAIVLSDYNKGALPQELTQPLIAMARAHKKMVIVDPKGPSYEKYRGAYVLKPNLKELANVLGPPLDLETVCRKAQHAVEKYDLQAILLTCSEAGMCLITREKITRISATQHEVFDVSGAGDTAAAYLAVGLAANLVLEEAVMLSNRAAGQALRKSGTAVVTDEEASGPQKEEKQLSWKEAQVKVKDWKQNGLKIGFTNGCFDILHPGHLSTIRTAKDNCDKLIVGLNTDASIRLLKGAQRPFQSENVRAEIIASLRDVDIVVLFDSYTPKELIELLQPDVLIKGAEYRIEDLAGAQELIKRGGKVILADMAAGFSTTQFVEKMRYGQQKTG